VFHERMQKWPGIGLSKDPDHKPDGEEPVGIASIRKEAPFTLSNNVPSSCCSPFMMRRQSMVGEAARLKCSGGR
jgi:hypothetical protein